MSKDAGMLICRSVPVFFALLHYYSFSCIIKAMKSIKKKKTVIAALAVLFAALFGLAVTKLIRVREARTNGILLCFDDYDEYNWSEYFDLLEKYDAHVTYFVIIEEPTDFCFEAIKRGHEIGYHSLAHTTVADMDGWDELYKYTIAPIETFREHGIELTTFAYPEGRGYPGSDEELLKYYKVIRGANELIFYGKDKLRHGFVDAVSIDNIHFENDEVYKAYIDRLLDNFNGNVGGVQIVFTHTIGDGGWCLGEERLEYLLSEAKKRGIKFYTFKELQDN